MVVAERNRGTKSEDVFFLLFSGVVFVFLWEVLFKLWSIKKDLTTTSTTQEKRRAQMQTIRCKITTMLK